MRFSDQVPARFQPAVRTVERLAEDDGCLAALLFGSIARGEAADDSDVDVLVGGSGQDSFFLNLTGGTALDQSDRSAGETAVDI